MTELTLAELAQQQQAEQESQHEEASVQENVLRLYNPYAANVTQAEAGELAKYYGFSAKDKLGRAKVAEAGHGPYIRPARRKLHAKLDRYVEFVSR